MVKNLSANAGDTGLIPGSGRFPGGGNDKSSTLACKIPRTEVAAGLQSMALQKSQTQLSGQTTENQGSCMFVQIHRMYNTKSEP